MVRFGYGIIGWLDWAITTAMGTAYMLAATVAAGAIVVAVICEPSAWVVLTWMPFLALFWLSGAIFANLSPIIWVSDECLMISFFLGRVKIRWEDVTNVGPSRVVFLHDITVVQAREITRFHVLYGLLYAHSGDPTFLIMRGIRNRDSLIEEIKSRVQRAHIEHPPAIPEVFHRWR